ncbi:hypothetical protein COY95_01120 [Candidatus Woesearchaeota archaeon CG_4_10_14_0_8_um_filter_47_5]|nr:MAG: hypothetical protein COY95_01120 [Candidatus Woesearchaeota archaeon CG_4_10_14_0_8_um_filter_47_5]
MKESLYLSKEELMRADHLLFVSLKYTRTVDVIKSVIERLISTYDFGILALLKHAQGNNKVSEIPTEPLARTALIKKTYPYDNVLHDYLNFYIMLRRISKANFSKLNEYRRHVTMLVTLDTEVIEINLDSIKEDYEKTTAFVEFVEQKIQA